MAKKRSGKLVRRKPSGGRAARKGGESARRSRSGRVSRRDGGGAPSSRKARDNKMTTPPATGTSGGGNREPLATAAGPGSERPAKVSSGLRPKDIEQFRRMLLEKRSQLVGDVSTLQEEALSKNRQDAAGDLSNMPIHMADLGTDNYEQEFTLGLIEGERALLREIDEALERIAQKAYGICVATGKPIGKARLRAKPWAKYCYEYTLAQERGRGRR